MYIPCILRTWIIAIILIISPCTTTYSNPVPFLLGTCIAYYTDENCVSPYPRNTPFTDSHAIFRWIISGCAANLGAEIFNTHVRQLRQYDDVHSLLLGILFYTSNEYVKTIQNNNCEC